MKTNAGCMNCFECVMMSRRQEIVRWLCSKYKSLTLEDSEDIVQESCVEVWKKGDEVMGMTESHLVNLWKTICRYRYTHWVREQCFTDEWDDARLQYGWEERDFGWDQGDYERLAKREALYSYIDGLADKDRQLMEMVLAKKRMAEISRTLGYSNVQVAKNRKSKIVGLMRRELPGCLVA